MNQKIRNSIRKAELRDSLKESFESSIDSRIARYIEIDHQQIIGNHYFAQASTECIDLYRDGYFISTVMVVQAVNEGIIKLIAERNDKNGSHSELITIFEQAGIISQDCAEASKKIWGSFRNDIHHMNPKVASLSFPTIAKENILRLATIETEIFGVKINEGKLIPNQPKYWDTKGDGTVEVYLRFS